MEILTLGTLDSFGYPYVLFSLCISFGAIFTFNPPSSLITSCVLNVLHRFILYRGDFICFLDMMYEILIFILENWYQIERVLHLIDF